MSPLLTQSQQVPPLVDNVYYKWRFYHQQPASDAKQTFHLEWQFGKIEYSVPKASPGTLPENAVHTLTTNFTMQV